MKLVLDSGSLIALEQGDRQMWGRLNLARLKDEPVVTHGGVIGQVWRGSGPRQSLLARALDGIEVIPLDDALGRAAGVLLGKAKQSDVIDAALVLLAQDGDRIVSSDTSDLRQLAETSGIHMELISV